MQPRKIGITALITLLAAATTAFTPNFPTFFSAPSALAQSPADRKAEADRLREQGNQQGKTSQFQAAIQSYQQALAIYREIGDRKGEAGSLNNLGLAYSYLRQYRQAIEFYQQCLAIVREIGNHRVEGISLVNLGNAYNNLRQYQKAIEFLQQGLAIAREIGERQMQGQTLNNLGWAYDNLGDYGKAIEYYQQSLAITKESGNRQMQGQTLNNLGWAYNNLGDYGKAIEYYQQGLTITRDIGDHQMQGRTLNNLGWTDFNLGDYGKAIEYYQQSLTISRNIDDRQTQGWTLNNLGLAYTALGDHDKAIEYYQQSLTITRDIGDRQMQGRTLSNLGLAYMAIDNYGKAIEYYQQSLTITRNIGDRQMQGRTLSNLGLAYMAVGNYGKAIEYYQQSLTITQDIGDRQAQGGTLSYIGYLLEKQNQPELSIVFYKQSINVREAIRRDIRGLPKEQQQSYTETVAATYRRLADLLLKQDRVLEAQRVLDLLKVQELEDYLSNVRGSNNSAQGVAERSPEQQIRKGTEAILDKAIQQGKELVQLESLPVSNRTETQRQRVIELRKSQEQITQQFLEFLKSPEVTALVAQLRQTTQGQNFDLENNATSLQDNLKRLQQDAVILYPFVLDDRLELVVVTPYAPPIRHTVAVKREELNAVIVDFRTALKNPSTDAKTPARKLYDWLIKPIENDLTQAKTKTIIYAPDGQLRYIPLAALYDGNQWLVQRFGINNITALSLTDFNTKPQGKLQVLAGAFTQGSYSFQVGGQQFSFQGLKYAGVEVENLAKTVPGTTRVLDKQFNRDTVLQMNDYSVVHLATHATFVTGQPEESFILFGNGDRATLRDIERWRLPNVDLMVLSACETGLGDKLGDGKEILGFGYQMQRTGARAAVASLWSVDDGGTQALMDAFYAALENGNTTKSQALRQAQIVLITGDYTALGQQRGLGVQERISTSLPQTVSSRLNHPYYWAPFILIGNGL